MTVAVDVIDHTGMVPDHEAVRRLVEMVLQVEEASGEVAVAFVDEPSISELNRCYRETEGSTDVLAFDYAGEQEWPGEAGAGRPPAGSPANEAHERDVAGEVVVAPPVVARYAAEEGRDATVQLGWTLIHGTLHLAGYDHETDQGEMREREQELLARLEEQVHALVFLESDGEGRADG
jgi:probable rRNA maturation factor